MDHDFREQRRDFRLHYLQLHSDDAAPVLRPSLHWWEQFQHLVSMVDCLCQDWEAVQRLGGTLRNGDSPTRAALIMELGLDVLPAPTGVLGSAKTTATFTARCIASVARAHFAATKLRTARRALPS